MSEKRPAENGDSEARPTKKPRIGNGSGGGLKRVAEIVLVLSAMAKIRGGKKPTEAEVELMAEAREKLVDLCEGLAPKDIIGQDAIGAVIEDLGLNAKSRDQKLGFRGPRLTIVERFSQAKRKMEESRKFAAQSSPYTQTVQTSFNAAAENRGTSHTVRMIPSDKPSHPPISSAVTSASLGHVSTAAPSIQYQLPTSDVRASKHLIFYNLERQICYEVSKHFLEEKEINKYNKDTMLLQNISFICVRVSSFLFCHDRNCHLLKINQLHIKNQSIIYEILF